MKFVKVISKIRINLISQLRECDRGQSSNSMNDNIDDYDNGKNNAKQLIKQKLPRRKERFEEMIRGMENKNQYFRRSTRISDLTTDHHCSKVSFLDLIFASEKLKKVIG